MSAKVGWNRLIIVRKDGCLSSLAKDCDGQAKLSNHCKNCVKKYKLVHKNWEIEQRYEWFNCNDLGTGKGGNLTTNVLRFYEIRTKGDEVKSYQCEWLFSWRLSVQNCQTSAFQARLRWEEEDLFNTLKNRGFNLKHDYSRDPRSFFNWHGLALFAFGIFELFRFSRAVKQRCNMPQVTLAEKLESQLFERPTEELFSETCLSIRVQFRYDFVIELAVPTKVYRELIQSALDPGRKG